MVVEVWFPAAGVAVLFVAGLSQDLDQFFPRFVPESPLAPHRRTRPLAHLFISQSHLSHTHSANIVPFVIRSLKKHRCPPHVEVAGLRFPAFKSCNRAYGPSQLVAIGSCPSARPCQLSMSQMFSNVSHSEAISASEELSPCGFVNRMVSSHFGVPPESHLSIQYSPSHFPPSFRP